jgi:hypothetical protein
VLVASLTLIRDAESMVELLFRTLALANGATDVGSEDWAESDPSLSCVRPPMNDVTSRRESVETTDCGTLCGVS